MHWRTIRTPYSWKGFMQTAPPGTETSAAISVPTLPGVSVLAMVTWVAASAKMG
ncbi:MAG: hypothetical protein ACI83P_002226 [Janthinobacterium sp.]|jgi:hypothetical protein